MLAVSGVSVASILLNWAFFKSKLSVVVLIMTLLPIAHMFIHGTDLWFVCLESGIGVAILIVLERKARQE